jgi:hypothetical protein
MFMKNTLLLVAAVSAVAAIAGETEISKDTIQQLIADLVSPNVAPRREHGPRAIYPPEYDRSAQAKVSRAFNKLYGLGTKGFPFLFDHFEDKQYSLTGPGMVADENKTVGDLCFDILKCHLQPYEPFARNKNWQPTSRLQAPNYFGHFQLRKPENARTWWEARHDKSLKDLQIEILEWIVAEEEKNVEKYDENERDRKQRLLDRLRESEAGLKPSWPFAR